MTAGGWRKVNASNSKFDAERHEGSKPFSPIVENRYQNKKGKSVNSDRPLFYSLKFNHAMNYTTYPPYTPTHNSEVFNLLVRLDDLLLDRPPNRIKLQPASAYSEIARNELQTWMQYRNRYVLSTVELVNWLKTKIGGRRAIEIGAGNDDLAYHLGIRAIGSYPVASTHAAPLFPGQIPTRVVYSGLREMDAMQAILELRPEVAIGAWIPDKFTDSFGKPSKYAPNEYQIIQNVEYIHIGCESIHERSTLLGFPHAAVKLPGLVSRTSMNPPDDVIHVWKKKP